jgi:hypothetical protein
MFKLKRAYAPMPGSDERRASLSARTAQNTTMPLPALVLAPEDAEARDAKASRSRRPYCMRCWQWLSSESPSCATCGKSDAIIQRERRVRGWIGVQRYLSAQEFGLDFIRHGRKIEIGNKDLFHWTDDSGTEAEYPIDDPRNRGRLVGEIHLDHCRVTYMKDRFDRNDPAWEDMVRIVRREGPLRPDKARDLGFGENTSPLYRLYQAFRRSSPKPKVAGAYAKLLVVPNNERAEEMAQHFYAGEQDYISDARWFELVEEADRELLVPPTPPVPPGGSHLPDIDDFAPALLSTLGLAESWQTSTSAHPTTLGKWATRL